MADLSSRQKSQANMDHRKAPITGTAGFIGFYLARLLLADGFSVQCRDGMTNHSTSR
jgi:nucleoside-diphosphate-sugar epimerase